MSNQASIDSYRTLDKHPADGDPLRQPSLAQWSFKRYGWGCLDAASL